jgi:2-polyprenyl-3-methyl-5-hydroxy-6-metoxy-1,4-benzoquinol methylase
VGCGDGKFTAHFASRVSHVLGIDASPAMIEYASKTSSADPSSTTQFRVVDCRHLETEEDIVNGTYDKVLVVNEFSKIFPGGQMQFL